MSEAIDRPALRRAIREYIQNRDEVTKTEVITEIGVTEDLPDEVVRTEFDKLERSGFLYCVGDGGQAEVRIP